LADWEEAEAALTSSVKELGLPFEIDPGGGAFYGPKIDIKIEDAIGREWQCSTIQFDFNLPERFNLSYTGPDGKKHRPFMVHRALLGSIERFFGILVEHYEGKFPFWLAPTQVKILALKESVHDYCYETKKQLQEKGLRVSCDVSKEKLGYKIRSAREERVPYMIIIGAKEAENKVLSVRSRDDGELGQMSCSEFLKSIDKSS